MRAHGEEAVELLAIPQEPQEGVAQPSVNIGVVSEDGEEESRLLLRFAAPRDPVMVADWVSFNVIDTERQDWARGWVKLRAYVERVGNARVPYGHREGATPLGQWLSNLRRPGALDGHPAWKTAPEAVDEGWNPQWPAEWQRHYAALRELVRDEGGRVEVLPGVTVHGTDVGEWLARQRQYSVWAALADGQRERLKAVGVVPLPPQQKAPAKAPKATSGAFERGLAAP